MSEGNKKYKINKRRMSFVIFAIVLCTLLGVYLYSIGQSSKSKIEFIYQGTSQTSAQMNELCTISSWSTTDLDLKILDHEEDVSTQVEGVKAKTEFGMDITFTWKEESFILHVSNEKYTAPIFEGPKEINSIKGNQIAEDLSTYGIIVKDVCGKDISEKMKMNTVVDTASIGKQEVILSVEDEYLHKSEYPITFNIEEEKPLQQNVEYNDGIANPFTITPEIISNPEKIDVLVNKYHVLPDVWAPSDLVQITSNNSRTMHLRQEAAAAFEKMNAAALQDDIVIRIVSAYRTKEYQQSLFNNYYSDNPVNAYKYSAVPRRSEHETGLAIDVSYDGSLYTDLHTSDLGKWMYAHAHEYGFMLRFLEGKESITNYAFEPWHYRYVGSNIATKIVASGNTMEEYYGTK